MQQSHRLVGINNAIDRACWVSMQQPLVDAGTVEVMLTGQIADNVIDAVLMQTYTALLAGCQQHTTS